MKPARSTHLAGLILLAAAAAAFAWAAPASLAQAAGPTSAPSATTEPAGLFSRAFDWFEKGGPIMYPIALMSLVGLAFVIERAAALSAKKIAPQDFRKETARRLDELDVAGAIAECEKRPCSFSRIVLAALRRSRGAALHQSADMQEMERAAEDAGIRELWQLRSNFRPIGIVAQISPLLGLLGTISGMIGAFKTMGVEGGTMGNPSAFAADIHEALFTTFFGLSVAIPMLLCFHWLHGKAEAMISEIEQETGDLLLRLRDRKMQSDTSMIPDTPEVGAATQKE